MNARIDSRQTLLCIVSLILLPTVALPQAGPRAPEMISLEKLPVAAKAYLLASGGRYQKPGKEIVLAAGAISRNQSAATPIQITWEFPGKLRIEEARRNTSFDQNDQAQTISPDKETRDLIDLLFDDTLEGFFESQKRGSTRFIGSGYRIKGAPKTAPAYDLYEATSANRLNGNRIIRKQYWFDSRTKYLARVLYKSPSIGGNGLVQISLDDWRDVQGEKIPFLIERRESGTSTLQVRLMNVQILSKSTTPSGR
jgi:hypothetical protein